MLVLSREVGEFVVIDSRVTVKVIGIQGNKVKIAFDAPREVPIHRGEVEARITGETVPQNTATVYTCLNCLRDFESAENRPRCRFCASPSCRKAVAK